MQKTADEMRSSDWSADVCSSDLLGGGTDALQFGSIHPVDVEPRHVQVERHVVEAVGSGVVDRLEEIAVIDSLVSEHHGGCPFCLDGTTGPRRCVPDRKRVEQGQSVAVRGDIGVRSSIKKK